MATIQNLKKAGSPLFKDSQIMRANELLMDWDGNTSVQGIGLVGLPLSKSSISHSGGVFSPQTIRKCFSSFTTFSIEQDIDLNSCFITDFGDVSMHVTDIIESQNRIEQTLVDLYTKQPHFLPIILGGDHSVTAPSVKAFSNAKGKVGIIQFDAHHDLRNLQDGGPSNGTPFRQLLENNIIDGQNLYQIGIRNFSNGKSYTEYGKENNVHIFTMSDVRQKGIVEIVKHCVEELKTKVDMIYVSLDMDVFDQAFAPGCPAIGPDGMDPNMMKEAIYYLGSQQAVAALDIVEIDPTVDFRDMTSRLAAYLILTFMTGYSRR